MSDELKGMNSTIGKKPYTVVLTYAEVDEDLEDTATIGEWHVYAFSVRQAVFYAKHEAKESEGEQEFEVVAVYPGHVVNEYER